MPSLEDTAIFRYSVFGMFLARPDFGSDIRYIAAADFANARSRFARKSRRTDAAFSTDPAPAVGDGVPAVFRGFPQGAGNGTASGIGKAVETQKPYRVHQPRPRLENRRF